MWGRGRSWANLLNSGNQTLSSFFQSVFLTICVGREGGREQHLQVPKST